MKTSSKARFGTVGAGLAAILLASMALATLPAVFASNTSYNNVQVFVTTSSNLNYTYFFTAYNLTGHLVGTTQTPYPAAGFELPRDLPLHRVSHRADLLRLLRVCPAYDKRSGIRRIV